MRSFNLEKTLINILVIVILVLLFSVSINENLYLEKETVLEISVITNEHDDTYWKNIRKGMDKASTEYNLDINFITLYDTNNVASQQKMFIQREIEDGADAIILSPVNDKILEEMFGDTEPEIPIICIKNTADDPLAAAGINSENEETAKRLVRIAAKGVEIDENGINSPIYVLTGNLDYPEQKTRYNAVKSAFGTLGYATEDFHGLTDLVEIFEPKLLSKDKCTIIATNESNLNMIARLCEKYSGVENAEVYGIGADNNIIYYLQKELIQAVCIPDYYSMGYLSAIKCVEAVNKKETEKNIEVRTLIVFPDTIFNNEDLLFPVG